MVGNSREYKKIRGQIFDITRRTIAKVVISFLLIWTALGTKAKAKKKNKREKIVIKFGTLVPEGSAWLDAWKNAVKELERKTNGQLKIITYAGGVMGDDPDMVKKMKMGQLDMAGLAVGGIYALAPEMLVLELPFLFESYDEVDWIRAKLIKVFASYFEKRGTILLATADEGFHRIWSKRPIRTLEDLRNTKVFVWQGQKVEIETFKILGVNPYPMPVPELPTAIQTGIVDTIYMSPLACVALQLCPRLKYALDIPFRYAPAAVATTVKSFKKFPRDIMFSFVSIAWKHLANFIKMTREQNKQVIEIMRERRVKFLKPSKEELEEWKREARKVWYSLAGDVYPQELLNAVLSELVDYRRKKAEGEVKPFEIDPNKMPEELVKYLDYLLDKY